MSKILLISKKDFKSNLLSIRMLIIILIFISIVVGGAYGIRQSYDDTDDTQNVKYTLFKHTSIMDEDDIANDMVLYVSNKWAKPVEGKKVVLINPLTRDKNEVDYMKPTLIKETNEMGRVHFKNITQYGNLTKNFTANFYEYELRLQFAIIDEEKRRAGKDNIYFPIFRNIEHTEKERLEENETISKEDISINIEIYKGKKLIFDAIDYKTDFWSSKDKRVIFHAVKQNGMPDKNAKLFVNETQVTTSDQNGYLYYEHDKKGNYIIKVTSNYGLDHNVEYKFTEADPSPVDLGADYVIYNMNSVFLPMVIPILSIAIAYDSVSKEKETNSLFYLLSRPIEKWKIAFGKLIGSLGAVALPMTIVNIGSILWIRSITTKSMSIYVIGAYLLGTLGLMSIYLIIQMIISTLSNSTGTAILGGIGIWIVFNVIYNVLNFIVGAVFGVSESERGFRILMNKLSLINPSRVYTHSTNLIISDTYENAMIGIPEWSPHVAFVLWLVIPAVILLLVFKYKI